MERQLRPVKLLILLVIVVGLGFALQPVFNSNNNRVLLQGKLTKTSPICDPQRELLSTGKILEIPGVCDNDTSIIVDNSVYIITSVTDSFQKHQTSWNPGDKVYVIAKNVSQARGAGEATYSLDCDTCRAWVVR